MTVALHISYKDLCQINLKRLSLTIKTDNPTSGENHMCSVNICETHSRLEKVSTHEAYFIKNLEFSNWFDSHKIHY